MLLLLYRDADRISIIARCILLLLLYRDAAHAEVALSYFANQVPVEPVPVADAAGPHFAIMREAIQQAWKLEDTGQPVHVVPLLLPGAASMLHICCESVFRFVKYLLLLNWTAKFGEITDIKLMTLESLF